MTNPEPSRQPALGLFDLARDPGEDALLPADHPGAAELRRLLERRLAAARSADAPEAVL